MTALDLRGNSIGERGAAALAQATALCFSLTSVALEANPVYGLPTAQHVAGAAAVNDLRRLEAQVAVSVCLSLCVCVCVCVPFSMSLCALVYVCVSFVFATFLCLCLCCISIVVSQLQQADCSAQGDGSGRESCFRSAASRGLGCTGCIAVSTW